MRMSDDELLARAAEAARRSYSPYSRFPVGAALLCAGGRVVTGTNVENRSYGLAICAERTAIFTAVAEGLGDFEAIAISCPEADYPVAPCGACRQVLSEFCRADTPVIFAGKDGKAVRTTLGELLPRDSLHELAGR
jgi:cytidine deaminase